VQAII